MEDSRMPLGQMLSPHPLEAKYQAFRAGKGMPLTPDEQEQLYNMWAQRRNQAAQQRQTEMTMPYRDLGSRLRGVFGGQ